MYMRRVSIFLSVCLLTLPFAVRGDAILQHLRDPRVQALLDTIAYAEGTLHENGYTVIFGNDRFHSYDDHPRRTICAKSRGEWLCSSAAGRYQLNVATWDHYTQNCKAIRARGDTSFSPLNQDRVALQIIIDKKALDLLFNEPPLLDKVFCRLNATWASLPGAPYGQPTHDEKSLCKVFNRQLATYKKRKRVIHGNA